MALAKNRAPECREKVSAKVGSDFLFHKLLHGIALSISFMFSAVMAAHVRVGFIRPEDTVTLCPSRLDDKRKAVRLEALQDCEVLDLAPLAAAEHLTVSR